MTARRIFLGGAAFLLAGGFLLADEVVLQTGGRLMGVAQEEGDVVIVETRYGTVRVPRDMVLTIDRTKRSIIEDYRERAEGVDMTDPDEVYQLAKWAKANRLESRARELFQRVIELNPEHEFARRELGYKLFQGRWMTEEEIMLAKGFVRFRGRWVTPNERALALAKEQEKRERREELARKRREKREARRREELARRDKAGYREDIPEVWPTISPGRSRNPSFYGWPVFGVQLSEDYTDYVENIYKFYGISPGTYTIYHWPFYRSRPWDFGGGS